jgi:uncharacterized protein YdhG (YjbR/CyaY superfamily)
MAGPATIDEYLARVSDENRAVLEHLRGMIHAIIPRAQECISYRIPAFRLDGVVVAGFAARANGCSYYPFSGRTLATLAGDLEGCDRTKSALHFDAGHPLPEKLVRKLIRTRLAETRG